jgi:FkbM family methyltransferase
MFRSGSSDLANIDNIFVNDGIGETEFGYGYYGFSMPCPKRILDLGAYCGFAAVYFANRFPHAAIICVEPPGSNFDTLLVNTSPYPNIRCVPAAIWPERTHVSPAGHLFGDWGNVFTKAKDAAPDQVIPAYTITDILRMFDWDGVDFIKCMVENIQLDVLCARERPWLDKLVCVCTRPPGGSWSRPDDELLLDAAFPGELFDKTRQDETRVFTRRTARGVSLPNGLKPIRLIPPSPEFQRYVVANIPEDSLHFYKFDYCALQLAPNAPASPPATISFPVLLDGHSRFSTRIIVGPTQSDTITFKVMLTECSSGAVVLQASKEIHGEAVFDWELSFPPASGSHDLALSTEYSGSGGGVNWARCVDPKLL